MKAATLSLTPELFIEFAKFCKDGTLRRIVVRENPLPDDAKVIAVQSDGNGDLALLIGSESFENVSDPPFPVLASPVFETIFDEQ